MRVILILLSMSFLPDAIRLPVRPRATKRGADPVGVFSCDATRRWASALRRVDQAARGRSGDPLLAEGRRRLGRHGRASVICALDWVPAAWRRATTCVPRETGARARTCPRVAGRACNASTSTTRRSRHARPGACSTKFPTGRRNLDLKFFNAAHRPRCRGRESVRAAAAGDACRVSARRTGGALRV